MNANDFEDWYADECRIDAEKLVGPNAHEFAALLERYLGYETRREAARIRFQMIYGA